MPGQLFFPRRYMTNFKEQVNAPAYLDMVYKERI